MMSTKRNLSLFAMRYRYSFTALVIAAGCGDDSDGKKDASLADGGRLDARQDVSHADAVVDGLAPPDLPLGTDSADVPPVDAWGVDAPVIIDGPPRDALTRDTRDTPPRDAPDASRDGMPPPRLDTAPLDGSALDAGARDANPAVDGATAFDGSAVDGVLSTYVAQLSGAQAIPAIATTATGSATLALSQDRTQLSYRLVHNLPNGTAAAIHLGAAGATGPVLHNLAPFGNDMIGTLTISPADADSLETGMLYINVTSSANTSGILRGQILRPGDTVFVAHADGAQEVPPVASTATAHAALILDSTKTTVRYHVTLSSTAFTGVLFQTAIATLTGPTVQSLPGPFTSPMHGTFEVSATAAQSLTERRWYINLLTATNPAGELRGQLLQPGEALYSASLDGASETPPITTAATGGAQLVLDTSGENLLSEGVFTGLTSAATGAHIHEAAVGSSGPVVHPLALVGTGVKGTIVLNAGDVTKMNAGSYYINVHTANYPNGEIRGQLARR